MKRFGLIGHPLGHSLSKEIHQQLFLSGNIDGEYQMFDFPPEEFESYIPKLKELNGFNCTIPFKQTIIPYLDELDERAKFYGSVNTVKKINGKWIGYNTDWLGFVNALKSLVNPAGKDILVIGAGGVSRMMAMEVAQLGAVSIDVFSRTKSRAEDLAKQVSKKTGVLAKADLKESYHVILNGSPSGMWPLIDGLPIPKELIYKAETVYDTIYNPLATRIILEAQKAGLAYSNGLSMLVGQAAEAQKIWLNKEYSIKQIRQVIDASSKVLNARFPVNIVLTGFMGSGKTTIGKMLAKNLAYDFIDLDLHIEKSENMSIKDIFSEQGEAEFRQLEAKYLKELLNRKKLILALGGGAIIQDPVYDAIIEKPCRIVYLHSSQEAIWKRIGGGHKRPLLNVEDPKEAMASLYQERLPIYEAKCHVRVNSDRKAEIVARDIQRILEEGL